MKPNLCYICNEKPIVPTWKICSKCQKEIRKSRPFKPATTELSENSLYHIKRKENRVIAKGEKMEDLGFKVIWLYEPLGGDNLIMGYSIKKV